MTLGDIISEKRKSINLSQEQLAKRLSVSRSAIAKWESNKGMPDIDNIKALAKELNISIDELLNNSEIQDFSSKKDEKIQEFISKRCIVNVNLTDWNDGIYNGYLLKQDKDFLYYVIPQKKKIITGLLAKEFITGIELGDKKDRYSIDLSNYNNINRQFFVGKKVNINLNEKHIWNGIIGKETEFLNVIISSFTSKELIIQNDNLLSDIIIPISEIVKIEVGELIS